MQTFQKGSDPSTLCKPSDIDLWGVDSESPSTCRHQIHGHNHQASIIKCIAGLQVHIGATGMLLHFKQQAQTRTQPLILVPSADSLLLGEELR